MTGEMPEGHVLDPGAQGSPAGLYLLFASGARPRRSDILAAVDAIPLASVSHDPRRVGQEDNSSATRPGHEGDWLEIMVSGLTFDLLGLAPGPSVDIPEIAHPLACDAAFDPTLMEALAFLPGPHLADAANSLPIVRGMLQLACDLVNKLPAVAAVCWSPARTVMPGHMLCKAVEAWLSGGPFPAIGLTAIRISEDGVLVTEGLDFFIDRELRLEPGPSQDRLSATRLAIRLIHEMVGNGPLDATRDFVTEDGDRLSLVPDDAGSLIRVARM